MSNYWRNCKRWYKRSFLNKATAWVTLAALLLVTTWCVVPASAGDYFPDDPLYFRVRWDSPPPRGIEWAVEELNIWWEKPYINIQHIVCWPTNEDGNIGCSVSSTIYLRPPQARVIAKEIFEMLKNRHIADGRDIVGE
jgi:hypothetical protein